MTERDSGGGSVPLPSELADLLAARDEAEAARAWDRFLRSYNGRRPVKRDESHSEVAADSHERSTDAGSPPAQLPATIGPYRILRLLGEGGMGLVYEAEQRSEVRRRLALKVLRPGLEAGPILARFDAERQALAMMQHSGIARLYDAGITEDGRPYFAMELVDGEPLTDFADLNKLRLEDRIRLFVRICHAVQHAHLKGVVHRDLKPTNILVTTRDGVPEPKIIDFGIAKAMGDPLTTLTLVTQLGQALGTPAYMSPEQCGAFGNDVDSRTDVYSLGVTLYELTVGRLPIDPEEIGARSFLAQLCLVDSDPPTPSTRFSTLDRSFQEAIARYRRTDPGSLRSELHGDLDWIVMKAIDRNRERRYETPNALAADLERHLNHEPVLARPPGAAYRAGKFVRRHRFGVAVAAAIAVLLTVSTILLSVQAGLLRRERDRAKIEAQNAAAVLAFMDDVLDSPDPYEGAGQDVTVLEALDAAVPRLQEELGGRPIPQAAAEDAIGRAYLSLGRIEDAEPLLASALDLRRAFLPDTSRLIASSVNNYAAVVHETDRFADAEPLYREAVARYRALDGEESADALEPLANLALLFDMRMERFEEADSLYRAAIAIGTRMLYTDDPELALWRQNYAGYLCYVANDSERGIELLRMAIPSLQQEYGPESVNEAVAASLLGYCLTSAGEYAEAEAQLLRVLPVLEAKLGPDHQRTGDARERLARLYEMWERPER